ncbi:LCP family protein [Butyrivibrio proteoclasticus]|uniref:LCP family protein n=1 Tax=Butyrivibrio proteoclasticus TaxID=43305 RepID=UPI000ADF6879|nr:LCP family protein [Butyrivibrio proteoclasticus]
MGRVGKVFLIVWAVLMTIIAGGLAGFEAMRLFGKSNLDSKSATSTPMLDQANVAYSTDTAEKWESDWVRYNGEVYDYNEDIITFLIMGIDKDDKTVKEVKEGTDGGQADALFLLVLNPHDESIKIIGINRNTMTDVDIYDEYGRYMTTMIAQIAVQHGFGNGMEESCEYQVKAVSNLFYQLPIHGYAAINMSAIPKINDMVGGVDVTVLEDLTKFDKKLVEGEQVHLEGDTAFRYVKCRDISVFGSSDRRLERQRQYLNAFIKAARAASSENNNTAIQIFTEISDAMVTNISADEVSYLAPDMIGYSFDSTDLMMIEGQTTRGEDFEEFYVDEDDLYKKIIEVFYEKVNYVD